jgi:transposase
VARSTIQDNLRRAQASGIAWPVPAELTDDILEQRLFARGGTKAGLRRRSEPDRGTLARELKRAGVSLMVLWEEYRETQSDGYGYSRFCDLFREFERRLSPVMRQHHVAGDKVDYSGERIAIVEPKERQSATSRLRHEEVHHAKMEVRTSRGLNRAMLFSEAILLAEWEANAPLCEAMAIKRERWRVKRAQERRVAERTTKQRSI